MVAADEKAIAAGREPVIQGVLRSKVYLELMKHKRAIEQRELESINQNIELFK
jgi:hypothetical protein